MVLGGLDQDERERIRGENAEQLGAFGSSGEIGLPATSLVVSASYSTLAASSPRGYRYARRASPLRSGPETPARDDQRELGPTAEGFRFARQISALRSFDTGD
jgi:hypothetical protein